MSFLRCVKINLLFDEKRIQPYTKKETSIRFFIFDIIRIISCFLIVLMHAPMPTETINGPFVTALSFFTEPAIGLFFMISGALILPLKTDTFLYLKSRLIKVGLPLFLWTIFYLILRIYYSESEINIFQIFFSIPFSNQGHGVFWFLYVILGLYLVSPILSSWVKSASKKEFEFFLLLWSITLCYPILDYFLFLNETNSGILFYFSGYIGYYLLGYYLKNFTNKWIGWISFFIGCLGVVLILYFKSYNLEFEFYSLFWYLSIFIVAWSIVYWKVIIHISKYIEKSLSLKFIKNLSDLTFGIYLIHIFIMREVLWRTSIILNISNYYLQTLIIALLSFLFSIIVCFVLSKIPFIQLSIGINYITIKNFSTK